MDVKLTTKSQEAVSAAAMNANTAGNPQIEAAHLLKALMDHRESIAVALLKAVGAEPDAVSTRASAAISSLPSTSGDSVSTPSSPPQGSTSSNPPRQRPSGWAMTSSPPNTCCWA